MVSVFNLIQQLIMLSASANKLSKLKEQAEGYAALIMEELDPENLGYIEVRMGRREYYETINLLITSKKNHQLIVCLDDITRIIISNKIIMKK